MSNNKEYKTVDELIQIMTNKGLSFKQPIRAKRLLEENNYYCLMGFKNLFYKTGTRLFKDNLDFEDLYNVFIFDKSLKTTLLKHLLFIESKIKAAINQVISPLYGIKDSQYLKKTNYNQSNPNIEETLKKDKTTKKNIW